MGNPKRLISETDLQKEEVKLLGILLQGLPRKNLRAGLRLVRRGWAQWREPDGEQLELTPIGLGEARKLWPNLDEDPFVERPLVASEGRFVDEGRQLAIEVPPLVSEADGLRKALAKVVGAEGLADAILDFYPQGRGLATASVGALRGIGVPSEAAERIHDAFVLARSCRRRNEVWGRFISSAEDMAAAVYESCGVADLDVEHFWVGSLDSSRSLIEVTLVAKGSLSQVSISMCDIFTPLCRARAAACFLVHNHPSCDLRFSSDDLRLTQRIMAYGKGMEIELLDHIVLAPDGRFASVRDERLFREAL